MNSFLQRTGPLNERMDASPGSGPSKFANLKRDTPLPMRPAIPRGLLQFPPGTEISYRSLIVLMEEETRLSNRYDAKAHQMVRNAFRFADELYKNSTRRGTVGGLLGGRFLSRKLPTITHDLTIAMRTARFGQSREALCAALLHDTVEDGKATPEELLAIFAPASYPAFENSAELEKSAQRVVELVLLLTKPRFSAEGKWIFPDDPAFFKIKDQYSLEQYDVRSNIYYSRLLKRMDMAAIFLKILDNIHNAENMQGIPVEQRQRNLRTMITYTLDCAIKILDEQDVEYLLSLFRGWGFEIPDTMLERPIPKDGVALLPSRGSFREDTWTYHPRPSSGPYLTLYSDLQSTMGGFCEVGFPSLLEENESEQLLRSYLAETGHPFKIERGESMVTGHLPIQETIFVIRGIGSLSRFLVPSETPGYVALVNEKKNAVIDIRGDALTEDTIIPRSDNFKRAMAKVNEQLGIIRDALKSIYKDHIANRISSPPPQ